MARMVMWLFIANQHAIWLARFKCSASLCNPMAPVPAAQSVSVCDLQKMSTCTLSIHAIFLPCSRHCHMLRT